METILNYTTFLSAFLAISIVAVLSKNKETFDILIKFVFFILSFFIGGIFLTTIVGGGSFTFVKTMPLIITNVILISISVVSDRMFGTKHDWILILIQSLTIISVVSLSAFYLI